MSNKDVEFSYRPLNPDDKNFLHDSWGSSYYSGNPNYKKLTPEEFHSYHRPIRERFFSKSNTTVVICCPKVDPWLIVGWVAVEVLNQRPILHYIYVKSAFKNLKIASELIKRVIHADEILYTHQTIRSQTIFKNNSEKYRNYFYAPHLV